MPKGFDSTSPPLHYVLFVTSTRRIWIMLYVAACTLTISGSELFLRLCWMNLYYSPSTFGYGKICYISSTVSYMRSAGIVGLQYFVGSYGKIDASVTVPQLWSRPPPGWVKANVNASVSLANGNAALGGVFRDENGTWIYGFACDIGQCYALLAIDNNLIDLILNWIRKEWQLVFQHVPQNLNHVADRVAALGRSSPRDGLSLASPLVELLMLVEEEKECSTGERVLSQDWCTAANVAYFNLQSDPGG
ncbi:hypothetical protein V6N12_032984 [Hibiscus sabdariffa]|uniref:RNase H type-1 domain-containing protein n=1 Tax=Hibiscus sabdariffa TaxID=183260 RepID=A0ABR2AKT4_9ROSI